jgi:hypothetical protein
MPRSRFSLALAAAAALACTLAFAPMADAQAVPRFGTADIVLTAAGSYDGSSGSPNPFEIYVPTTVVDPQGRVYAAEAFFDGNGAGGMSGNVWRLRVYCDLPGTWSWRTASPITGLGGRSGSFTCSSAALAGAFGQGPIVENPRNRRTFMYQYGRPVFLAGKFLDSAASSQNLRFSQTLLSESYSDATRQALLDRHRGMALNKMNVYLANKGDYHVPTTPWRGTSASNDKTRFELARWHTYDAWTRKLRDAGMLAELWFFADDSNFGALPDADRRRLIRYAMARLSGYVNTKFVLALEWQEGWSQTEVASHATFIHAVNPWARMVSVHGTPGDFSFPTATWADFMAIQAGNGSSYGAVHASTLRNRARAAKPVIQEEHGLGAENTIHRQRAWAAFAGGAAGVGTGAYLQHLVRFTNLIDFSSKEPHQELVTSGSAYLLATPGFGYIAYLPAGGAVGLDLRAAPGTFREIWYDPRTGALIDRGSRPGGRVTTLTAPASGDWTVVLGRQ